MMKIRIEGGGTTNKTRVTNAETGEVLPVTKLSLDVDPSESKLLKAQIEVLVAEIDIGCDAEIKEKAK